MPRAQFAVSALAIALLLGGCTSVEPIVPHEISTMVNEQGRERTYDLAWQDIRRFEGALGRGEDLDYSAQAVVILSRMNRLAEGKATGLRNDVSHASLRQAEESASRQDTTEVRESLARTTVLLREFFDDGDFFSAQDHALEALGLARALSASG